MELMKTSLPALYTELLDQECDLDVGANHTDKLATVIFCAVSKCLGDIKSEREPVAFSFVDLVGETLACAVVKFNPNEDTNEAGNWQYIWSFDKADIPENARVISISDPMAHTYFISYAGSKYKMSFENPATNIINLSNYFFKTMKKYLEENQNTAEVVSVELEEIFSAKVQYDTDDNKFYLAIVPGGAAKELVKGDSKIEVK